ncbi:hypothetical protein [Membranihabitans maritimus]|uniref:hypothetical protein n=1 Tax=Membranihabitans maritimus TaxID=2904244 RepID=UPI001F42854C|nr:hypothetical protein [Membranihabitans maritimus]
MKKTGIWIDKRVAKILTLDDDVEKFETIESDIDEYRPKGGSGTRMKGGPQDVVQDSKYLEREKHQYKGYFKLIADTIKGSDAIVIFGPAQTGEKLNNELAKSYPDLFAKVKDHKNADSMTDNQIKAMIRDFFAG